MADVRVNPIAGDFAPASEFRLPNEASAAEIALHAPENPSFKNDESQAESDLPNGRPEIAEQRMPAHDQKYRDGWPRKQQAGHVRGLVPLPPEIDLGMDDEPEKWNRRLQKQHQRRDP